jgi:hypothetical protein
MCNLKFFTDQRIKKITILFFLLVSHPYLVFSQETDTDVSFWRSWINGNAGIIGKDISVLQAQYKRTNSNDSDYTYMLTRTIVDGSIVDVFLGLSLDVYHNVYVTSNSRIGKMELVIKLRSTNASETENEIIKDIILMLDSEAKRAKSSTGKLTEHWYGDSFSGVFVWDWTKKNVLVLVKPSENQLLWTNNALIITIVQR